MQGYNEQRWQAMLDEAGYPRSMPTLPRAPARATAAAPKATADATAAPEDATPPGPGTGYPK